MPHRFRVVTTYSYTAKSVKDDLQKSANVDVNMMRQRLIKQIETFGTISQDVSLYFPMEFGDTLAKLKDNNPTLHEKILPIITQLRKELHTQITTATTPMGRVRRTLNTHQIVEHTTKKKIEENRIERDQLIKKKEKLESELDIWRKEKEKMEKKAQKIDELLKRHTLENSLSLIQQAADQLRYTRPKINKTEGVNGLKEFISNCYQMLYSMRLDVEPKYEETNSLGETDTYWIEVRRNIKEFDDNIVQGILNNAFGSTHSILNTYSIDTYFFEGRYKKDHDHAVNAFEIAKKNLKDAWIEAWITALKITDSKYKDRQKDAHSECTISQYEYEKSAQELKKTELRIITNQDKEERIKHRSAEDMKRCHSFVDLLDEEYLEELKQRMKSVYETKDDSDSLIQLLSFVELKNQREELMALNANLMN
jgi:predicted nuclease with TOPRIM domain